MGSFKSFLAENEDLFQQITDILDELSEDEIDELGYVLYSDFFTDTDDVEDDEDIQEFSKEDVIDMIKELGPDMYEAILEMLEDDDEDDDEEDDDDEDMDESSPLEMIKKFLGKKIFHKNYQAALEMMKKTGRSAADIARVFDHVDARELDKLATQMNEAVSRFMKARNMNKKKRKFMSTSKAELRRTKAQRRRDARKNKAKARRYYKANKAKIAKYQKSRSDAIKKGKHKVKKRRNA